MDEGYENIKSDVRAKEELKKLLKLKTTYLSVEITSNPTDIKAITKTGEIHYYEVKYTTRTKKYFGAATTSEWKCALENWDRFWFVIAIQRESGNIDFVFKTPSEFLEISRIRWNPQIIFEYHLESDKVLPPTTRASTGEITSIINFYRQLRNKTISEDYSI